MKQASRQSKRIVGGFIIFSIVIIIMSVFTLGGDFAFLRGSTHYKAGFNSTDGLGVGAPVKMGGVVIGEVDKITLENNNGVPRIIARLNVVNPYNELVKSDSVVSTQTQGVLGDKFISIKAGTNDSKPAEPNSDLTTDETNMLEAVVSKSGDIIDSVNALTKRIESFATNLPNENSMRSITQNTVNATTALAQLTQHLNSNDSALKSLGNKDTDVKIQQILENLRLTTNNLASVTRKINEGQGSLGALVNDSSLYDDMKSLMGRANRSKTLKFVIQKTLSDTDEKEGVNGK